MVRFCAAQSRPVAGEIEANLDGHQRLIELADLHAADLIFFPELSLTGYEPRMAGALKMNQDDARLDAFQSMADAKSMIIGIGIPAVATTGIHISMVLFQPGKARVTYAKQQLHTDEEPYFVPGDIQLVLDGRGHRVAPAICYESLQASHAQHVAGLGADVYLASVAKGDGNVARGHAHYPAMARQHRMTVLMANCLGPCDDFVAVGRSAVWDSRGELGGHLDDGGEGIVMIDTATQEVALHYLPAFSPGPTAQRR